MAGFNSYRERKQNKGKKEKEKKKSSTYLLSPFYKKKLKNLIPCNYFL